jgi:hypothetical protein
MVKQLLLALVLTSATVAIHAAGTIYVAAPLGGLSRRRGTASEPLAGTMPLIRLVSCLLLLHVMEMCVWAAAFSAMGIFADFETAVYYSFKSYTTVGYGDVLPPVSWRLIGPIEAAVGVLMLGWSTGFLVAAVQRLYGDRPDATSARDME